MTMDLTELGKRSEEVSTGLSIVAPISLYLSYPVPAEMKSIRVL